MTLGSHQRSVGKSQTYLTPKWLVDALGPFDLDPCAAPYPRPWPTATEHYSLNQGRDGLVLPWTGRVWLNPPFDRRVVGEWLSHLGQHGDGIALVHARTETAWFKQIWEQADGVLFLEKRITFCDELGVPLSANSGAPVVLAAYGERNVLRLRERVNGTLLTNWETRS